MMNVLHSNVPEPSLALMSKLDQESDGGDVNVDRENLTRGQHFFAQLFSSGPVPGGYRGGDDWDQDVGNRRRRQYESTHQDQLPMVH
jgi:hypothetical protein